MRAAEVVFLATPFQANEAALETVATELAGKVLVDCTNLVSPGLSHGLENEMSGAERVQALVPAARVVKAFSIYGFESPLTKGARLQHPTVLRVASEVGRSSAQVLLR